MEGVILAIETSCDETAVAVVRDGRHILTHNSNGTIYVLRLAP